MTKLPGNTSSRPRGRSDERRGFLHEPVWLALGTDGRRRTISGPPRGGHRACRAAVAGHPLVAEAPGAQFRNEAGRVDDADHRRGTDTDRRAAARRADPAAEADPGGETPGRQTHGKEEPA